MANTAYPDKSAPSNQIDKARYTGDYRMGFDDSPAVDAFGRLRASLPRGLFEYQNQYDDAPLIWENIVSGTGAVTHLPLESSVQLSTGGTDSGASAIRQTYQHFRYRPGRSLLLLFTGVLGLPKSGVVSRAGFYNDRNGAFFQVSETGFSVVIRSDTTGSIVDTVIPQDDWNMNRLDGKGTDELDIDPSKAIIGWIDIEWLGVGRVRFGVVAFGKMYEIHRQNHTNVFDRAYMRTANLPIRYEVTNIATAASATTIKSICASLSAEGDGDPEQGYDFATDTGATQVAVAITKTAVLSIRPRAIFKGQNNRSGWQLKNIAILTDTKSIKWEIVYNATVTGGTWAEVNTDSATEVNTTMTGYSGGIIVESGYVPASNQVRASIENVLNTRYPFARNNAGTVLRGFTIVLQAVGGQAGVASAGISWREFY